MSKVMDSDLKGTEGDVVQDQIWRILDENEFLKVGQVGPTTKAFSEPIKNLNFEFSLDFVNQTQAQPDNTEFPRVFGTRNPKKCQKSKEEIISRLDNTLLQRKHINDT